MAITLTDVKTYLRVDFDCDDGLLNQCLTAAESYLENAISDYQSNLSHTDFQSEADILKLAIISEMYRNRDFRGDNRQSWPYYIRSMITQLQNFTAAGGST